MTVNGAQDGVALDHLTITPCHRDTCGQSANEYICDHLLHWIGFNVGVN